MYPSSLISFTGSPVFRAGRAGWLSWVSIESSHLEEKHLVQFTGIDRLVIRGNQIDVQWESRDLFLKNTFLKTTAARLVSGIKPGDFVQGTNMGLTVLTA